jgi:hypothetical protein
LEGLHGGDVEIANHRPGVLTAGVVAEGEGNVGGVLAGRQIGGVRQAAEKVRLPKGAERGCHPHLIDVRSRIVGVAEQTEARIRNERIDTELFFINSSSIA